MLTPTHLVTGQCFYLAGCILSGHPASLPESVVAMLSALIPDLDSRQSYIGRLLPFISWPLEYYFGHRTLTHSLLMQLIASAVAYLLLPFGMMLALLTGWLSHVMADMMTPAGVCWLWPSRVRSVLPGHVNYRIQSTGSGELVFLLVMAVSAVLLQPLSIQGRGTVGLIRDSIGNIERARHDYDADKGDYQFSLQIEARDNRSYANVSGNYAVIGPYRENGFLLATANGISSICKSSHCDWYAEHVTLIRGEAEQTTAFEIVEPSLLTKTLIETVQGYEQQGEVYLLGSLSAKAVSPRPPVLEATADTLTFHYARIDALHMIKSSRVRDVKLVIQVRHPLDTLMTPIEISPDQQRTPQNDVLQKWL